MAVLNIKECFNSRFLDGVLVEADYRQLEIRVLALATMDRQLIEDIVCGIDLHRYFAAQIYNKPEGDVTDYERKLAKGFSFQLQYGASAYGIAKHWNVEKRFVQKFIEAYYARYPDVKAWQEDNLEYVKVPENLVNEGHRVKKGPEDTVGTPVLSTVLPGIWEGQVNPYLGGFHLNQGLGWNGDSSFTPTQIKNYPIQGGAADLVLLMLGALNKNWNSIFLYPLEILPINTVHDSFLFDVDLRGRNLEDNFIWPIKESLEQLPLLIEDMFGIVSPVQFPVDIAIGSTWSDMKELDLDK